jgi:beta-phosphoglucomutase family hydrolase
MTDVGLPPSIHACLFDMDGVLTKTATLHAAAWKDAFDEFLRRRSQETGEPFVPFDEVADYLRFVDGKPRADGVRSFLASRGIELAEGAPDDAATEPTVHGVGNLKNGFVQQRIRRDGVDVFDDAVPFLEWTKERGWGAAVVTSSANAREVLDVTGLDRFFDVCVDGVVAADERLAGKPAPDTFLAAATRLGVDPSEAAVFEDALSGVDAGRRGHFGVVVGVDRSDDPDRPAALRAAGADLVVGSLAELRDRVA